MAWLTDHRDYVEADGASAAACLAGYVKLTMGRPYSFRRLGGFEVENQLVFGRLPDRALGRHDAALIEAF
jgi:hypothetical protein